MAWEKRCKKMYFYRSVRCKGKVRKVYYGTGPTGKLAAETDALRRAEQRAGKMELSAGTERLQPALNLARRFEETCALLASANLLAAGFHRPYRHSWRTWIHGRRAIRAAC